MSAEKRELVVGDVVYTSHYGSYSSRSKVVEVAKDTATTADGRKFKTEVGSSGWVEKQGKIEKWSATTYYIETEEIKREFERALTLRRVSTFDFKTLSDKHLQSVYNILVAAKKEEPTP